MATTFTKTAHMTRRFADGTLDWDTDTFKLALVGSGYVFDPAHTQWSDASAYEVAAGNGYTTGGATIQNRVAQNDRLTADTVVFPLLDKTFRGGVMYCVKTANGLVNPILGYILFNDTPQDITINGLDYTIAWNALGVIALS